MSLTDLKATVLYTPLDDLKSFVGSQVTLDKLVSNQNSILDFWHIKCTRCPAALSKLSDVATENPSIRFFALSLSRGDDIDIVKDVIDQFPNLTHLFVDTDSLDLYKDSFGYSQVPFYAGYDNNGASVKIGSSIDLSNLNSYFATQAAPALSFEEDF